MEKGQDSHKTGQSQSDSSNKHFNLLYYNNIGQVQTVEVTGNTSSTIILLKLVHIFNWAHISSLYLLRLIFITFFLFIF